MTEGQLDELVQAVGKRRFKTKALWEWFKEGVKPEHFVVSGLGRQLIDLPTS